MVALLLASYWLTDNAHRVVDSSAHCCFYTNQRHCTGPNRPRYCIGPKGPPPLYRSKQTSATVPVQTDHRHCIGPKRPLHCIGPNRPLQLHRSEQTSATAPVQTDQRYCTGPNKPGCDCRDSCNEYCLLKLMGSVEFEKDIYLCLGNFLSRKKTHTKKL